MSAKFSDDGQTVYGDLGAAPDLSTHVFEDTNKKSPDGKKPKRDKYQTWYGHESTSDTPWWPRV
jgi:hypothetical protein